MDNYHVTKHGDQWELKKEAAKRASLTADTKKEIMDKTRDFMQGKVASVKVHGEDGRLQEERTFQREDDPRKSKG